MSDSLYRELKALEGAESGLRSGNDRVNEAMIRHWCEAMQDGNPVAPSPGCGPATTGSMRP